MQLCLSYGCFCLRHALSLYYTGAAAAIAFAPKPGCHSHDLLWLLAV
jgi:hypothetical protein